MSPDALFQVVVAGGGVAGLETVMALRALAGGRVHSTLVTPERDFVYRPLSVAEPFGAGEARRYPLEGIAHEFGVELLRDQLERVEPDSHRVFTSSGEELEYDALVLATG